MFQKEIEKKIKKSDYTHLQMWMSDEYHSPIFFPLLVKYWKTISLCHFH